MYTDSFLMFITTYKGCNAEELRNNDDKPRWFNTGWEFCEKYVSSVSFYVYIYTYIHFHAYLVWKKKKKKKRINFVRFNKSHTCLKNSSCSDVIYENYPCPLLFDVITMSEQVVDLA